MGWIIGAKCFEVEGADMNPTNEFMIGVKNSVMRYGQDKTPPNLTLSYGSIGQTKNVGPQTRFTIAANDANGVIAVMYRIGSGEWQAYGGSFTLEGFSNGTYSIECVAVDSTGNIAEFIETVTLNDDQ